MKMKILGLLIIAGLLLTGCSGNQNGQTIKVGTTEGIYAQVVDKALVPALKEQGYKTEVIKYSDLIEPNTKLAEGEIDANLFQQSIYLEQFKEEYNLELSALTEVPSVGLGLYSNSITSLDDIPTGSLITIPNDELGTARALRFLEQLGMLTVDPDASPYSVSEQQIVDNPKKIKIQPVITSQLIASLASGDAAVIPDNYILANEMELQDALAEEQLNNELEYIIAVKDTDMDEDFAKALKKAIQSDKFKKAIQDEFQGFGE
ncbi:MULTISPECIES: MetQ/NlpA family ABC transporter substrate-binding protein [unclassified Sporosarcina]|uniref:MetQ/NlpA family ABC transporter substrate-binding protein n=1 Tax=unclassified Sporosarcina TaxID=2647733 RepID=UPI00203EEBD4|nr:MULTISPECIES: MetQ/NlpA family ABC transporter substrate-binding protein [unclassified Sporosarcina]